jgi:hypothetical protein
MNELDKEARALFGAAREGHEPSETDRKRVLKGVLLRSAASAATAATVGSAAAKGGAVGVSSLLASAKIVLGFAVLGAVSAGAYRMAVSKPVGASAVSTTIPRPLVSNSRKPARSSQRPPASSAPAAGDEARSTPPSGALDGGNRTRSPRALDARANSAQSTVNGGTIDEAPLEAVASSPRSPAVAAFPDPSPDRSGSITGGLSSREMPAVAQPSTLSAEARGLANVQRALREGRNAEALGMLRQQRQEFTGGDLVQEREAAWVVALCAVGRVAEAQAAGMRFLAANPASPLAARIRSTCAFR